MVFVIGAYAVLCLILIGGTIFLRGRGRKVLASLAIAFVGLPLCLLAFIGFFKTEIQQGRFIPGLGPFLLLVAPPENLRVPLAFETLDPDKREYRFRFQHKYVGKYVVALTCKKLQSMEIAENNLKIQYAVSDGSKHILIKTSQRGLPYWGANESGLIYISYDVPEALPIGKNVEATIKIQGDIEAFVKKYGPARIVVRKGSDL